jgi:hypothetical protein
MSITKQNLQRNLKPQIHLWHVNERKVDISRLNGTSKST